VGIKAGEASQAMKKNKPGGTTLDFIDYQYDTYKIKYNNKMVMMRDIRWGSSGNIAANGCGVIAAYNVFVGLGYNLSFDQVLHQLSCMDAPLADGLLGVNPVVLFDYMKFRFKNVSHEFGEDWNTPALEARAVIILYKYPNMAMHYVAGIKDRVTGYFRLYNAGPDFHSRNISIGNYVKYLNANGIQMMSMICIY